jgi:hypothetical protein
MTKPTFDEFQAKIIGERLRLKLAPHHNSAENKIIDLEKWFKHLSNKIFMIIFDIHSFCRYLKVYICIALAMMKIINIYNVMRASDKILCRCKRPKIYYTVVRAMIRMKNINYALQAFNEIDDFYLQLKACCDITKMIKTMSIDENALQMIYKDMKTKPNLMILYFLIDFEVSIKNHKTSHWQKMIDCAETVVRSLFYCCIAQMTNKPKDFENARQAIDKVGYDDYMLDYIHSKLCYCIAQITDEPEDMNNAVRATRRLIDQEKV